MSTAQVSLSDEVRSVLDRSTIEGNNLTLPEQLERKLYQSVAKVIELAGGKWNRKSKCHVFDRDPRAVLGLAIETGKITNTKKLRQAFYTPDAVADLFVLQCDVAGKVVLEPSAGGGSLIKEIAKRGAKQIDCYELEGECLNELMTSGAHNIGIGDFLLVEPPSKPIYDRVVMNPPFTRNAWLKHVLHAMKFLKKDGILHSVVPINADMTKIPHRTELMTELPEGAFKESGTMIATKIIRVFK